MPRAQACKDCGVRAHGVRCRPCNRLHRSVSAERRSQYGSEWQRSKKYGMEPGEFDVYWIAQRGQCWICERSMRKPLKQRGQPLDVVAIDHDHSTGRMRGLLCNACNKGIGLLRDDVRILKNAIKYLEV